MSRTDRANALVLLAWTGLGGLGNVVEHQMPLEERIACSGELHGTAAVLLEELVEAWRVLPFGRFGLLGHGFS
jgi:hypothetical protein